MAQVKLTINGRSYSVACGDGQESHIEGLAADIDARVHQLSEQFGAIGEGRLLVMTALLLADELHEATNGGAASAAGASADDSGEANGKASEALEAKAAALKSEEQRLGELAEKLDQYAEKLEAIAARLVEA